MAAELEDDPETDRWVMNLIVFFAGENCVDKREGDACHSAVITKWC
jgi:hypothetical protein